MPGWGADDRCQLCFDDEETVNHRFVCKVTLPEAGWPTPPCKAVEALSLMSIKRQRILQLNGLLAVSVPRPLRSIDGWFSWPCRHPPHIGHDEAIWFIDVSLMNGRWHDLSSYGFAVVTTLPTGKLLGFGHGSSPD